MSIELPEGAGKWVACPLCGKASGNGTTELHTSLCVHFRKLWVEVERLGKLVERHERDIAPKRRVGGLG